MGQCACGSVTTDPVMAVSMQPEKDAVDSKTIQTSATGVRPAVTGIADFIGRFNDADKERLTQFLNQYQDQFGIVADPEHGSGLDQLGSSTTQRTNDKPSLTESVQAEIRAWSEGEHQRRRVRMEQLNVVTSEAGSDRKIKSPSANYTSRLTNPTGHAGVIQSPSTDVTSRLAMANSRGNAESLQSHTVSKEPDGSVLSPPTRRQMGAKELDTTVLPPPPPPLDATVLPSPPPPPHDATVLPPPSPALRPQIVKRSEQEQTDDGIGPIGGRRALASDRTWQNRPHTSPPQVNRRHSEARRPPHHPRWQAPVFGANYPRWQTPVFGDGSTIYAPTTGPPVITNAPHRRPRTASTFNFLYPPPSVPNCHPANISCVSNRESISDKATFHTLSIPSPPQPDRAVASDPAPCSPP